MAEENTELNEQQKRFCEELVLNRLNQSDAYSKVYKAKSGESARAAASRLLADVNVQDYVSKLLSDVKAEFLSRVPIYLDIISANCNANISDYLDIKDGRVCFKDWDSLSRNELSSIAEVQILREFKSGDGKVGDVVKFKLVDKKPYLELMTKYLNLINEKISHELTGKDGGPVELDISNFASEWLFANTSIKLDESKVNETADDSL